MTLKLFELIDILLLTFVSGMFWGPWLALTRSMASFEPEVFLAIVRRMNRNMGPLMTWLMPAALASTAPVLFMARGARPWTFVLTLAGLILFGVTLAVTMVVEVPIVARMAAWTVDTMPDDWERLRDRWGAFHLWRIGPSVVGLGLVLVGAVF